MRSGQRDIDQDSMSALGQKQTFAVQKAMSALPPKANICSAPAHVRFGPKADSCTAAKYHCHSMISSAWASNVDEIVRPSARAALTFKTTWNFVGCSTGKLAGFAPLMILSTYDADRSYSNGKSAEMEMPPPAAMVSRLLDMSASRCLVASSTRIARCGSKRGWMTTARALALAMAAKA